MRLYLKGRLFIPLNQQWRENGVMVEFYCWRCGSFNASIYGTRNVCWNKRCIKSSLKISSCLRVKHNEALLNSYQSERSLNVKEYIETTMRMGEFVNAVESIQITKNISSNDQGVKSMQSIKPKLGKGLGHVKDKNRGKIFPQFKLDKKKNLDEYFSKKGIIILSSDIRIKNTKNYSLLKVKT